MKYILDTAIQIKCFMPEQITVDSFPDSLQTSLTQFSIENQDIKEKLYSKKEESFVIYFFYQDNHVKKV